MPIGNHLIENNVVNLGITLVLYILQEKCLTLKLCPKHARKLADTLSFFPPGHSICEYHGFDNFIFGLIYELVMSISCSEFGLDSTFYFLITLIWFVTRVMSLLVLP